MIKHLDLIATHKDKTSPYVVAEGPKIVIRMIESTLRVIKIYTDEVQYEYIRTHLKNPSILESLDILILDKAKIQEIAGYKIHQGIIGISEKPPLTPLHEVSPPFIILDRLHNAENVGSIIRTAYALGINQCICDENTSYPFLRRSVRVSMGAALYSRFTIVDSLEKAVSELSERHTVAALEISDTSESLYTISPDIKIQGLIVGSEHDGIHPNILRYCKHTLHIPMHKNVLSSLNVGVAAGIAISHLFQGNAFSDNKY